MCGVCCVLCCVVCDVVCVVLCVMCDVLCVSVVCDVLWVVAVFFMSICGLPQPFMLTAGAVARAADLASPNMEGSYVKTADCWTPIGHFGTCCTNGDGALGAKIASCVFCLNTSWKVSIQKAQTCHHLLSDFGVEILGKIKSDMTNLQVAAVMVDTLLQGVTSTQASMSKLRKNCPIMSGSRFRRQWP